MAGLMEGKKGIIFGVSNKRSIGYGIANSLFQQGADIAFTYAGDSMKDRVTPIAESMNSKLIMDCDVQSDEQIKAVFDAFQKTYGQLDFVVHSVAFANRDLSATEKKKWEANVLGIVFSCIAGPVGVYCNYYPQNGEVISSIYGKSDDIVLLLDFACAKILFQCLGGIVFPLPLLTPLL